MSAPPGPLRLLRPWSALVTAATVVALIVSWAWLPTPGHAEQVPQGVWPLQPQPEVMGLFDPPDSPYGSGHRGVDLAGWPGQVVRTALPGTVRFTGRIAGVGIVVVGHGATRTTYQPVAASVEVGAQVAAGDPIGTLEVAGSHCLPTTCLHWGWIRGETYLDPLLLVGGGPVRLLPLHADSPSRAGALGRDARPHHPPLIPARHVGSGRHDALPPASPTTPVTRLPQRWAW